jgi:hypothetical protein
VHESLDKLLRIRKTHKFNNNPYIYSQDFNENSTCFRCVHLNPSNISEYDEMSNRTIFTERDVIFFGKTFFGRPRINYRR